MVNTNSSPPLRKVAKQQASRGLMKISVNYLSVSMYLISISLFSMWSLRKWCLILLWKTVFLVTEMALVLSHMRGTLLKITLKSRMVWQSIGFGSSSYIHSLCGGLSNWRLLSRTLANKRRSEKMTSTKSALSVNPTPCKISIEKTNKIKWSRSKIPNPKLRSVFEVSEDSLNCHSMWKAWGSLKACTKIHVELNVRPYCREVQDEANHAPVLPLVHSPTVFIWIEQCCRAHRSWHGLELIHVELLHQVLCILALMYEGTLPFLLHLDT
jgi:hypothetical protein